MSLKEQVERDTLRVIEGMQEQTKVQEMLLPAIPEEMFVHNFLPLFAGKIEDEETVKALLIRWFEISKSPMLGVRIIKSGTNEHLFTVPSIFYSKMFDPNKAENNGTFKDLIAVASSLGMSNPYRMENYLINDLEKKFDMMRQKGHVLQAEENQWKAIFERYGYSTGSNTGANTEEKKEDAKPSFNNLTDDDLVDD